MLEGGIAVVVVVAALAAFQLSRSRSHDDVHSVEGYHRKLHTLEEITVHPVEAGEAPPHPDSALRIGSSRTVRLTDGSLPPPPPVPPPLVPDPSQPVRFDDAQGGLVLGAGIDSRTANDGHATNLAGRPDRAMSAMNRRPRRLAGPLTAVAAVLVLIVVLIVAGIHKTPTKGHGGTGGSGHPTTTPASKHRVTAGATTTTTSTTVVPSVSMPQSSTLTSATYTVSSTSYSVVLSVTGPCWVYADNATTGAVLYTGDMVAGKIETLPAQGPINVEVGAPANFGATVNGQAVTLPIQFAAPFTLHFVTPGAS